MPPSIHFSAKMARILLLMGCMLSACAPQATSTPIFEITEEPTLTPIPLKYSGEGNLVFLSIEENGRAHLFVYHPQDLPLMRITSGDWNDTSPALSPDRTQLAFASDRNGFWDLYVMDLRNGNITQITNSTEYDSAPSWSPDSQWLVFETYTNENLNVAVISMAEPAQGAIAVTQHPASDHSPVWAPDGRHIAFVSSRGGNNDIWLADLDLASDDRYQNLSNTSSASEAHPVWNYDGSRLLWASSAQTVGYSGLYVWDANEPERAARWLSDGSWGVWNETAEEVIAITNAPNQQYLTSYDQHGNLLLPLIPIQGRVRGLAWGLAALPQPLPDSFRQAQLNTPAPLWSPILTPVGDIPGQRWYVVPVENIQAPYPQLHDLVDEAFISLRARVTVETGWDTLASLENAFVPLTNSLEPGMREDWLYTGRAFAINSLISNAGWMVTLREDIGGQTYWRLYIRCTTQDGSLGEPLHDTPWDLNARYELNPSYYEQGGVYAPVPAGYWVDMTGLANAYGWERLPSLPNWRNYYAGTRFTEFALTSNLDWYTAMRELYPVEALITPTRVLPPSLTPTNTFTPTSTRRPTRTPAPPTGTRPPTFTPTASFTPTATATPPTIIPP
jgi:TolB protein